MSTKETASFISWIRYFCRRAEADAERVRGAAHPGAALPATLAFTSSGINEQIQTKSYPQRLPFASLSATPGRKHAFLRETPAAKYAAGAALPGQAAVPRLLPEAEAWPGEPAVAAAAAGAVAAAVRERVSLAWNRGQRRAAQGGPEGRRPQRPVECAARHAGDQPMRGPPVLRIETSSSTGSGWTITVLPKFPETNLSL